MKLSTALLLVLATAAPASPTLRCAPVFGNGAILQQGIPVPIWGLASPGEPVTVKFRGQTKLATTDAEGHWHLTLDALPADTLDELHEAPNGHTLTLSSGGETLTFTDLLIGEVWLCSGQSNMAAKVRHNHVNQDPDDNLLESNLPAIRQVCLPDGWRTATPGSVGEFTRVGFCFAREIHRELKVPVGLVNACLGGSRIESWMREPPEELPEQSGGKQRPYGKLYHARIAPLVGYGIRGTLWYQGEANASEGRSYQLKMMSLIKDWRQSWAQGDFPFYYVQLAGIGISPTDEPAMGDGRARIREAQRRVLDLPETGMAVSIDIGEPKEHPANKVEVGQRLAHWALHHTYGRKGVVPSGPLYAGHKVEGAAMRISFAHAGGLQFARKQNYRPPVPAPGEPLSWISLQGGDGTWHWAEARVDGTDLVVSSPEIEAPVAVRYAYTNQPNGVLLYNAAGFPASPFTTEEELK